MKKPRITFIIPAYNCEKYIERCLDSVCSQNCKDIEVIVVDDKSNDGTLDIIRNYSANKKSITVISNRKNCGVSFSRNEGLKIARGDYISFIDSDDYIERNSLKKVLDYISNNSDPDIVKFPHFLAYNNSKEIYTYSIQTNKIIYQKQYDSEVLPYIFTTYDLSGVWSTFIKRELLTNILFDEKIDYGEDMLFMNVALRKSKNIIIGDFAFYNYRQNNSSATLLVDIEKNVKQINNNYLVFKEISSLLNLRNSNSINNRIKELILHKSIPYARKSFSDYRAFITKLYASGEYESIVNKKKILNKGYFIYLKFLSLKHALKMHIERSRHE